jgi:membrane protein YfhO
LRAAPFRVAAAAIALLPVALLAEAVAGRSVLFERDIYAYWVPGVEAFVRAIGEGAWPLWDPLTNFGRPLLADPNLQFAYPPTWLNLALGPGTYYTLFVVSHCAWAGLGTLLLARAWGFGAAAAAWAAASWMLSGPLLSTVSLLHHFPSASWMGWVLLALERVIERPGSRSAAWLACAAAGMALAGSADICVMTGAAAVARVGFAILVKEERARLVPSRLAGALAGSCGLAALIVAVQWWPTLAYLAVGSRGAAGPAASMYWSAHPASLLDVVLPGIVAEMPLGTVWRTAIFEGRGPLLRSLYVGLPAVVLALVALLGRWRLRWLVAGLTAAFLIGALGRFTPVYPALAELPIVRLLRFPAKLIVPATLFLCLLSGAGIDTLRHEWSGRQRRWMILVVVVIALVGAAALSGAMAAPRLAAAIAPSLAPTSDVDVPERLRSAFVRAFALAAIAAGTLAVRIARGPSTRLLVVAGALALIDIFTAARGAIRLAPPELLRHRPPLIDSFPDPDRHRVYAFQYGLSWLNQQFTRPPRGWDPEWAWAIGHAEHLAPPSQTRWRIAGSFDGDFTGLTPVALTRLTSFLHIVRAEEAGLRLLQLASVTDVVAFEDSLYGLSSRAQALSVYTLPVRVFAVPEPLPRAYLVAGVRIDGRPEEPSVVMEPGFDPGREVALDPASGQAASPPQDDAGRAEIVARRSDRLTVAVAARRPSVLVVTEAYDPGWRAWVDGAPAPVWRANAIFRAVAVGEGDHSVEMRYRPPSVAWGAAASVVGAALAGVIIGRRRA